MRQSKRAAEALRLARAALARRGGWGKGANMNITPGGTRQYCAQGAILLGTNGLGTQNDVDRVRAEIPKGGSMLTSYNDAPSTRKKDVIALFDRAIARAEGRS